MKNNKLKIISITVIVVLIIFISGIIIKNGVENKSTYYSGISTNKKVYSVGESIDVRYKSYTIDTFNNYYSGYPFSIQKYDANTNLWQYYSTIDPSECRDGLLIERHQFDPVAYNNPKLTYTDSNTTIKLQSYEPTGTEICKTSFGQEQVVNKYVQKVAGPGKYKFVYEKSEAIIEIK